MMGLKKISRFYKQLSILVLNTILLFLCLELLSSCTLRLLDRQNEAHWLQTQASSSYYADKSWAETYWREHNALTTVYEPYVAWRSAPFQGETIQIDAEGFRVTPGSECCEGAYVVFVLGGSAVWGHGVPDWSTIPAYLQQELAQQLPKPVCVRNLGEKAFVSTQGLLTLERQLQQGNIPDLVIFYDGVNDVAATFASGEAGSHLDVQRMRSILSQEVTLAQWLRTTASFQLLQRGVQKVGLLSSGEGGETAVSPNEITRLAQLTADTYHTNYEIVTALVGQYDFETYFFWQPVIVMGNKPLTAAEQAIYDSVSPDFVQWYRASYQQVETMAAEYDHMWYWANIFDTETELLWLDLVHVTPEANELIAKKMAVTIFPDGYSGQAKIKMRP
jgi:lysophospholipase L1-like esterase